MVEVYDSLLQLELAVHKGDAATAKELERLVAKLAAEQPAIA